MSRTPGASCLLDVRTTAILQDYIITTNNCAPGLAEQLARRNKLGGIGLLENCQPPACGFDRPRDLLSILGAAIIIATVIGVIHTYAVFLPSATIEYNAGYIEYNLIAAMTYLIMLLTACVSYPVIEYAGHKLTALFGMITMFVGILLDSQVFHVAILYVGNIVMIGVGGGLAYAASMTLPADLFRAKLTTTLMLTSISGSVGTVFYLWLCSYVLYSVGYKWTKLLQAVLVLFFTLAVHVFPKTRLMYASGCDPAKRGAGGTSDQVRDCVYQAATSELQQKKIAVLNNNCDDSDVQPRNLLCVCVCDLRLYGDKSFLLWACLVMIATMNFYLPYLVVNSFAEGTGADMSLWYVTAYCGGSIAGRCAFVGNVDFTFQYNRAVFQGCIFASGVLWIVLNWAVTFGWIVVVCSVLGAIEGVICVVTSRVAIGTIPRRWLSGAWLTSMFCHAIGMFSMTTFTVVIAKRLFKFTLTFITSGIIQIIVSLLATLLPNEEEELGVEESSASAPQTNQNKSIAKTNTFVSNYSSKPYYDLSKLCRDSGPAYRYSGSGVTRTGSVPYSRNFTYGNSGAYGSGLGNATRGGEGFYKCQCAICSKFGCIPGCLPECTPAGSLDCGTTGKPQDQP